MENRIREIRKRKNLTLESVAKGAGTIPQTVSKLEKGDLTLSLEWMRLIAPALGCDISPADLLIDQDNPGRLTPDEKDLVITYRRARLKNPDTTAIALDSALLIFRRLGDDAAA